MPTARHCRELSTVAAVSLICDRWLAARAGERRSSYQGISRRESMSPYFAEKIRTVKESSVQVRRYLRRTRNAGPS
jgi:hypothetical protein